MDWVQAIQKAIDYIESHLDEDIDYTEAAACACSSSFHFQRVFGLLCGVTLGEYIRKRRLTLATQELLEKNSRITDIALKYGYETLESFSRAFYKFHGCLPSQIQHCSTLNSFSRLKIRLDLTGGNEMNYNIEEKEEKVLIGFKKRFTGVPYGEERIRQERAFATTTRAKQWLLLGASCDYQTDYCIVDNVGDDGYDFWLAYELDGATVEDLFNPQIAGFNCKEFGFEKIILPKRRYAIFETEKKKYPINDYCEIRKRIATEWLPSNKYELANAAEVVVMHWRPQGEWQKNRYIELRLPIV